MACLGRKLPTAVCGPSPSRLVGSCAPKGEVGASRTLSGGGRRHTSMNSCCISKDVTDSLGPWQQEIGVTVWQTVGGRKACESRCQGKDSPQPETL